VTAVSKLSTVVVVAMTLTLMATLDLWTSSSESSATAMPHPSVSSGVTWFVVPSINTGPATTWNTLSSISCGAATSCLAVGGTSYTSGAGANLAESWNGHALSLVPSLEPGPSLALSTVSCVLPDSCFVLGLTANDSTAFATWSDTKVSRWSLVPGENNTDLEALSCPAATFCTAVGLQNGGAERKTLVESWSGRRWSAVSTPNRGSSPNYDDLDGVSCASPRFCVAVGTWGLQTGIRPPASSKTLVEVWNGARWSVVPSPNGGPPSDFDFLNGVSCYSPTFCVAVGSYTNYGGAIERTLVERWNGRTWSILSSPNPGGAYYAEDELNGVSCPSRHHCVAVGDYQTGPGDQFHKTLVESWSGARWTRDTSAAGGSPSDASLVSVSCATAASCVAVGDTRAGLSEPYETLVEVARQ
jgi:hypothetical protein